MAEVQQILCVLARADREMTSTEIIDHDSRLTRYTTSRYLKTMEIEELITRRVEPQGGVASLPIHYFRITYKGRRLVGSS